jgi:hypothetical protein
MPLSSRPHLADWENPLGSCWRWSPFIKLNAVQCTERGLAVWRGKGNRDMVIYLSIVLFLCVSQLFSCLSVCFLSKTLYLCPPGHIMKTGKTPSKVSAGHEPSPNKMLCTVLREVWLYEGARGSLLLWCIYVSIHLYMYLYICFLSLCLSVYLRNYSIVLQATSCRLRKAPRKWLVVVGFHQIKCDIIQWKRSDSMKKQYLSISLFFICQSFFLYMYLSLSCLSLCLSVTLSKRSCLCPQVHIMQTQRTS